MSFQVSQKEAVWLSCKPKTCCYNRFVTVTGRDVWRISRALGTEPWSFLVYFQSPEPWPDSFIMDHSGRHFRLVLTKQPASKRRKSPAPCIFLMKTRNGHHRCGLGDLRPQVCKTFPIEEIGSVLCIPGETGCSCRAWSLADVKLEEEALPTEVRQIEFGEYVDVVQYWNAQVAGAPEGVQFDFLAYCKYLLQAYDSIAEEAAQGVPSDA